jgi:tRNA modification GTPase
MLGEVPAPRHAALAIFRDADGGMIDEGIALHFPAPHSYTGEDVLELHGHGSPVVLAQLVRRCVELGARLADPGEFTRRAFLNDRLDLAQAEAVADLIEADSVEAARGAARSLKGEFSRRVHALVEALIELRMHVEACIDFPEEEIDAADRAMQRERLAALVAALDRLRDEARQGAVLRDGLVVVLIGRPNVGKSSLLNRLAGEEVAIVTPVPGTTRDYVRATLSIEGVPIHLVDTAGLRDATDEVERIGVERAWRAVSEAGAAVFVTEAQSEGEATGKEGAHLERLPPGLPVLHVINKIDLAGLPPGFERETPTPSARISAKTGAGVEAVRQWLLETAGWKPHGEGLFMARERHVEALAAARGHLTEAGARTQAFELFAEELRLAQLRLNTITGEFGADDLLGEIFGRFCIGK